MKKDEKGTRLKQARAARENGPVERKPQKPSKKITMTTHEKFVQFCAEIHGPTPVGFASLTRPKTVPGSPEIFKLSRGSGFFGNYENAVKNLEEKEGLQRNFVARPRKWGQRKSLALVEHKGKFYCTIRPLKMRPALYFIKGVGGLKLINKKIIKHFLVDSAKPETQAHLEGEVIERDYKFESLRFIACKGRKFHFPRIQEIAK